MAYNTSQHGLHDTTGMTDAWSYSQHYKLGRDIVLNEQVLDENGNLLTDVEFNEWRGIGYENGWGDTRFCGEFDGAGYTIYGVYNIKQYCSSPDTSDKKYAGFFMSLGLSAYVHDLNFADSYVGSVDTYYTGGVCAFTDSNARIERVTYQGYVQGGDMAASIGGILGRVESQNDIVKLTDCKFSGTVRGYRCGVSQDYCGGVGGILGTASLSMGVANRVEIQGCESEGKVYFSLGVVAYERPYAALGGIVGKLRVTSASIKNCRSSSLIYVPGDITYMTPDGFMNLGGILGYAFCGNITVESCAFKGTLRCAYNGMGGIVGNTVSTGGATYLTCTNCYNIGTIENNHTSSYGGAPRYIGGIVGNTNSSSSFTNCYNAGTMTVAYSSKTVGEISYNAQGTISNCYYLSGNTDCSINDKSSVHEKTAEEFTTLATSLGSAYVDDAESGMPVLAWEV